MNPRTLEWTSLNPPSTESAHKPTVPTLIPSFLCCNKPGTWPTQSRFPDMIHPGGYKSTPLQIIMARACITLTKPMMRARGSVVSLLQVLSKFKTFYFTINGDLSCGFSLHKQPGFHSKDDYYVVLAIDGLAGYYTT